MGRLLMAKPFPIFGGERSRPFQPIQPDQSKWERLQGDSRGPTPVVVGGA